MSRGHNYSPIKPEDVYPVVYPFYLEFEDLITNHQYRAAFDLFRKHPKLLYPMHLEEFAQHCGLIAYHIGHDEAEEFYQAGVDVLQLWRKYAQLQADLLKIAEELEKFPRRN